MEEFNWKKTYNNNEFVEKLENLKYAVEFAVTELEKQKRDLQKEKENARMGK